MDMCLKGFRESEYYKRKNLNGLISLDGEKLSDKEVRLIVNRGINEGYYSLYDIPDEIAKEWLNKDKVTVQLTLF